ncbi:hypothetical protein [Sphaerisporangium rubeum]|uniref:Uncharacterized protein n=2 Tax=Sphaerisporangium rubeum TaxID=321317 RepID=A0A7X0M5D5_9ACTN|nr:hypothetical protein [Sphaerisporangium rubeum]MBB6470721.1 hypothetical protein [Sphaerisporangium rubeum]
MTPATVVVPPLADVTLVTQAEGHRVLDPGRRFAARLLAADATATGPHDSGELVVRLRAGLAGLADPAGPLGRLRAAAVLVAAAVHQADAAVEITLDDLELRDGTTEDSAAALRASLGAAPYDPEVDEAVAEAESAGGDVWLVLDRDQQLPAALAMAARLTTPPLVTGRFARAYWPVLSGLPPLRQARLAEPPAPLRYRVTGLPPADGPGPYWRERAGDPVPPGPWAGRAGLARTVADPDALIASGCTTVVLGICAADHEVVGRGGGRVPMERLRAAVDRLRAAGVTVLAELWLGAPGIGAGRARTAVATLTAADGPVDRLVGLRPFDWPVHWTGLHWAGTPVEVTPAAGDLARHHRFDAEGTLPPAGVQALIAEIGPTLASTGTLIPARVAAAYLAEDPRAAGAPGIALAPDTVLVAGPAPEWYAVDLRQGRVIRLDPRVATRLRTTRHPVPEADALPGVSPASRTRILDTLVGNGLLVRT